MALRSIGGRAPHGLTRRASDARSTPQNPYFLEMRFGHRHAKSKGRGSIHMNIKIKRVYEAQSEQDGQRVLVDRLWPCSLTKEKAGVDLWLKDIGPSTELRKWF